MTPWEYKAIVTRRYGQDRLDVLLSEGWEPFAATVEDVEVEDKRWTGMTLQTSIRIETHRVLHLRRRAP